ncbi:aminotransferase class I/II-fold pyridoxal phosphate-dependent enzyme, partial [Acinetobacter pittii]|uniref:aminotransferase class I/II-fold pyridoxal phosphate-dependent enzyme n=1 Tax=Acinetobacter pittii TaxID=48296 RepID=UPI00281431E2
MPDVKPYDECRVVLYDELVRMGYNVAKPSGAFYMYIEAPDGDSVEFAEKLKKHDVLVVPGIGFGTPSYVRLSYCCPVEKVKGALPAFEK